MPGITGIELGPEQCVLVRAGRDGSKTTVAASRTLAVRTGTSADHDAFVDDLRRTRRDAGLSAHARVVAWGVPGAQSELEHLPEIAPFLAAGFEIDAILSPAQAMARLVNSRKVDTSGNAVAVVSLNTHGVAIAIVSRGDAISSRAFEWPLGRPFSGRRPELLDRYLVISQVAPPLQHLIDLVRPVYGATVTSVMLCGNLPDLRSLAMLLIEEMDLEVETLDSSDLLESGDVAAADAVPALQLASVAALPGQPSHDTHPSHQAAGVPAEPKPEATAWRKTAVAVALILAGTWAALEFGPSSPAAPLFPDGIAIAASPAIPDLRAEATMGRVTAAPPLLPVSPLPEAPVTSPRPEPAAAPPAAEPVPTPKPVAQMEVEPLPPVSASVPIPSVDGIMISGERRLAIVGGNVVAPGDKVGVRTVARIDRDGVVLREPNGRELHVAIRTRR